MAFFLLYRNEIDMMQEKLAEIYLTQEKKNFKSKKIKKRKKKKKKSLLWDGKWQLTDSVFF